MRTLETLSLERFRALVEAYGAGEAAWPASERAAAVALCQVSAEARALRAEALALDEILAKTEIVAPSAALEARVLSSFSRSLRTAKPRFKWISAGAIAACLVVSVIAAWDILRPSHQVDLSDPAAWDLIGEDLEFPKSNS